MFVVTDAFCRSNYCQIELQQAYDLHKPIILVMEQTCDQELMSPLLNELFNRNTRVTWLGNDGLREFAMKTTWANICESILQLSIGKYT